MTILRRIGTLTLIPGIPGKPATPGHSKLVNIPDPPSQKTLPFGGGSGGAGVPVESVFGKGGEVVVSSSGGQEKTGGSTYPPTPGGREVDGYNGNPGSYVVIVLPDGSIRVVKV